MRSARHRCSASDEYDDAHPHPHGRRGDRTRPRRPRGAGRPRGGQTEAVDGDHPCEPDLSHPGPQGLAHRQGREGRGRQARDPAGEVRVRQAVEDPAQRPGPRRRQLHDVGQADAEPSSPLPRRDAGDPAPLEGDQRVGHRRRLQVDTADLAALRSTSPTSTPSSSVSINAVDFPSSLEAFTFHPNGPATQSIEYNLDHKCIRFRGTFGLSDDSESGGQASVQARRRRRDRGSATPTRSASRTTTSSTSRRLR